MSLSLSTHRFASGEATACVVEKALHDVEGGLRMQAAYQGVLCEITQRTLRLRTE